ncbi:MAG: LLM class flavin-dependent oxidoreductase [Defluviicoccus sp.]|nr:LLM class flavin-dependent oxidoreductase [Defluviicoccus sp.]MDE0276768.1 LLM class flavin-dependent oxidoreductase [Defluviicoccus sp.]
MGLGIRFDGFDRLSDSLEVVRRAEEAGADRIWMAEHMGYREAVVACTAYAMSTETATVIPTAISPYLWHPMPTAMSLATLADVAPGRVGVAVGVGNPLFLGESGVEPVKPVRAVREFVECLRALWTGEAVDYDGDFFRLSGARMSFSPSHPIPIYIAATGPQMLRLTGRIADGVVLSGGLTVRHVKYSLGRIADGARTAGRDPAEVRNAAFLYFSVSADGREAVDFLRGRLAFLFRNRAMAENIRSSGLPIDHEAIVAAVAERDMETAKSLVPDDAVDAFAVGGTVRNCRDRLAAYLETGVAEPVIQISGSPESRALAFRVLREFAAG